MSDGELVRQTVDGNTAAYEELVRRWSARILAVCHAKLGCRHSAEELAQEALLRGFRAVRSLEDPEKFGSWLCGIATHACLDRLKSKQAKQVPLPVGNDGHADCVAQPGRAPDEAVEHEDDLRHLMREVELLPEEYREVILLYYYEDITYRELGSLLNISPATVNARLTKGRALLRQRLNALRD